MNQTHEVNPSRRDFVKKSVYVTPAILTLSVVPTLARAGSYHKGTSYQDPPTAPTAPTAPTRP